MQLLRDYLNQSPGCTVELFGCGPSLDAYDKPKAKGAVRIAINAAAWAVPGVDFLFAHDSPRLPPGKLDARTRVVIEPHLRGHYDDIPAARIVFYRKHDGAWPLLELPREEIALINTLFGVSGTVHSALHFAWLLGAARVIGIGFDVTGGYAPSIRALTGREGGSPYMVSIFAHLMDEARRLRIPLDIWRAPAAAAAEPEAPPEAQPPPTPRRKPARKRKAPTAK